MRRFLRIPSPATAIALVALFVALGGTSYAALILPANSVGSKQLKKNAVTTKKIKNHAVTASKINPKGLTVPNATNAASATNAGTATNLAHQVVVHRLVLSGGQSQTILTTGALTLKAVCNAGSPVTAEYDVTSTMANTSLDAGPQVNSWGPGTQTMWGSITTYEANGSGAVIAPDGSYILNPVYFLAGGSNIQNSGQCLFGGTFMTN